VKIDDLRILRDAYMDKDNYSEAMEKCNELAKEQGSEITFDDLFKKGFCHIKMEQNNEAADCFTTAVNLEPQNVAALTNQAICFFNLGDFAKAFKIFAESIKIDPQNLPAWHYIGIYYLKEYYNTGDVKTKQKLVTCFRRMVEIDPNVAEIVVSDPVTERNHVIGEFIMLNSDLKDLSLDELTTL
jgi:tetratricopeptide (TPR) repeat protein